MFFAPFFIEFPDIAMNQIRVVTVFDHKNDLPVGEYGFINAYCTDETCDCRRVMINVVAHQQKPNDPPLAVLSYGWEPESFYRKWSPYMPDDELAWFKGPALDPFQPQSQYAEALLLNFKMMLQDNDYRTRLIRHYALFKQKTGMKLPKELKVWVDPMQVCGCGSGLKLRFCCGAK